MIFYKIVSYDKYIKVNILVEILYHFRKNIDYKYFK